MRTNKYREYARDESNVWLQYGLERAIIPIAGGPYFRSDDGGENWVTAGTLVRQ